MEGEPVNTDPAVARRHLATDVGLVVVHDVMAEDLTELRGVYSRAASRCTEGSTDYAWWRTQARAVRQFKTSIDVRGRAAMLAAHPAADCPVRPQHGPRSWVMGVGS